MLGHPSSPNDFRFSKMSSSIESDRGSLLNALNVFDRQDELVSILANSRCYFLARTRLTHLLN